jgi:hypothetical protein
VALAAGVAALAATTTALPAAGAAVRGGWAVSTLDAAPQAEPGGTAEIGFTVLQHGRTPVNVDGVALVVREAGGPGRDQEWPAVQRGATGHYVAEVTFPDEGRYGWAIRQGWFGDHELGTLEVGDIADLGDLGGGAASPGGWWEGTPWALRILLVLPILASAGLFLLDRSRQRRRDDRPDRPDRPLVAGA